MNFRFSKIKIIIIINKRTKANKRLEYRENECGCIWGRESRGNEQERERSEQGREREQRE